MQQTCHEGSLHHPRALLLAAIGTALLAAGSPARSAAPPAAAPGDTSPPEEDPGERLDPDRLEIGVLPAIGYDSDLGLGLGATLSLAQFEPGYDPYRWRLRALVYLTLNTDPEGDIEAPWHDDWVEIDLPDLAGGLLRFVAVIGFRKYSNAAYYGFGNASRYDPARVDANGRFYHYDRIYPFLALSTRLSLYHPPEGKLDLLVSSRFTYNWISVYAGSKLSEDLGGQSGPLIRSFLAGAEDHGELRAAIGLVWDGRDHETAPTCGLLADLSIRAGGGLDSAFAWGGANLTARFYQSLYEEYLVLAGRGMIDLLFGEVPFYEAPLHGGLIPRGATGGAASLRGVPEERFNGKVKLLANLELRSKFLPFRISTERFNLGALLFVDLGRVFTDYRPRPELDGDAVGLKVGLGGGLRLQWGEAFQVRIDAGYSPTEDTWGLYIDLDHIF